jgi:hypothetical protein
MKMRMRMRRWVGRKGGSNEEVSETEKDNGELGIKLLG